MATISLTFLKSTVFLLLVNFYHSSGQNPGNIRPPSAGGSTGFIPISLGNNPPAPAGPAPLATAPGPAPPATGGGTGFIPIQISSPSPAGPAPIQPTGPAPPAGPATGSTGFIPISIGGGGPGPAPPAVSPTSPVLPPPFAPPLPARNNLDMLTQYSADFLISLSKDQLFAFLRVFFMSRLMGVSALDPRNVMGRSFEQSDQRAIDTARSIPASDSQLANLEGTGLGQLLSEYATRLNSVPIEQRSYVVGEYQNIVDGLRIPKGVKYALKHIV